MNEQNKGDLHNQDDVNPGSQLEKMVNEENVDQQPRTDGTGSNKPVPREESLIINEEDKEAEEDDQE